MTTTRTCLLAAILCVGLVPPAFAQQPMTLSVDDAVARALAHAPRMADAQARTRAAEATVDVRAASGRPTVSTSAGFVRTNHVDEFGIVQPNGDLRVLFPDIPSNYRVRAELGVPLFTTGRIDALVDAARADERAAAADETAAAADVALDTVVGYWSLATARERVAVLERAQQRADALVEDAAALVDAGLVPPSERLAAEARRARQRIALIRAQNAASVAEAQLLRLVGLPAGTGVSLTTPVESEARIETADVGSLVARATASRPERVIFRERQLAADAMARAAAAALRPNVMALAAIEPSRPNARFVPRTDQWHTSWDLGVTVSWALFDGGRARAERAAALAQRDALVARLAEFDAAMGVELRQRQLDVDAARAAIAAAAEAVAAAAEARRVVGERFEAGVATSTEVLDSDVVLLEAELERAELAAALRVNEARLARALGERP